MRGFNRSNARHLPQLACALACALLGQQIPDDGIGVAVAHLVLCLQDFDQLHVLQRACLLDNIESVIDRLAVGLLDGRKVGGRAFALCFSCHCAIPSGRVVAAILAWCVTRNGLKHLVHGSPSCVVVVPIHILNSGFLCLESIELLAVLTGVCLQ